MGFRRLTILLLLTGAICAQSGEPLLKPMAGPGSGEPVDGIRATATVLKPEYGPGESIMVTLKLTNESDKTIAVKLGKNHVYDFSFEAKRNDFELNTKRVEFTDFFSPEQKLQPGDSATKLIDLRAIHAADEKWAEQKGKYEVRLCYIHKNIKSGWVKFSITEPGERPPELDPELAEKIVSLIAKLAYGEANARDIAASELVKIGRPAMRSLEDAINGGLPDDVRERCRRILEEIKKRHAPPPPPPKPPPPQPPPPTPPPEPPPDEF